MRILQVIPFFTPEMGGSAQVAYQIARHLGKRGHEVTVLASDYGSGNSRFEQDHFRAALLPCAVSRWGFYITPGLPEWLRTHVAGFDVVHMHTVRTFQNAVVRHFAVRHEIPYVLSAHGTLPVIVQRKLAKKAYDLLFGRALLASASRLIAVSPVEAEQYRQAGIEEERISVIYNGLDLEEFAHLPARGTFRSRFRELDGEMKVVLFLGRLHRRKGVNTLIEAFARLETEMDNSVLLIAGPDDGELAHLQALANRLRLHERVWFVGPLYGEDRLAALVDADVLASPAVHEIFGLAPFEALMCGTPVIVADDCGSGELIREAQAGYLVSYRDVDGLAAALLRALQQREEARQMVIAGQAFVDHYLDWSTIATQLEVMYRGSVRASAQSGVPREIVNWGFRRFQ